MHCTQAHDDYCMADKNFGTKPVVSDVVDRRIVFTIVVFPENEDDLRLSKNHLSR